MTKIDEDQIVRMLSMRFGSRDASIIRGIGDDAAVVRLRGAREDWVVTTDMLLEDIDFRRNWLTPAQLGHKSLAVNLSDLAAMGSVPRFFTVSLALPAGIGAKWIDSCYRGISTLARRQGALLIGGDLSRSPCGIQVTITALGETIRRRPVYRSGGRAGDYLYVTGVLGKAAAGLALLQQNAGGSRSVAERAALKAHRTPEPRCDVGMWLARHGYVTCMMDLSDGLSMDLPRLCRASGVGAEISGESLPLYPAARKWGRDPMELALNGGEDFELLFCVRPGKATRFENAYPPSYPAATRIGALRAEPGVVLKAHPGAPAHDLAAAGFDHFRE